MTAILTAFAVVGFAWAPQGGHQPNMSAGAVAHMKDVSFMRGHWHGKQVFNTGGAPLSGDVHSEVVPAVGGRYLRETLNVTMPGGRNSDTLHMLTWDAASKEYKAWWFNDTSTDPTEFSGELKGGTLSMSAKTGGGIELRVMYHKVSQSEFTYQLEMHQGAKWQQLFKTDYVRER